MPFASKAIRDAARKRVAQRVKAGEPCCFCGEPIDLALTYPEYAPTAKQVRIVDTTADAYYGAGYQDVQNRVPNIDNTMRDLAWKPTVTMKDALKHIFDAYRGQVLEARQLVD